MNFLNPYEVLELNSFDTAELKKAKKRKLTEFDLSDNGSIDFKTQKIHKADFIKAVDELDNEQKNQFYWSLKSQPNLSNFLSTGDSIFFSNFEQQRVFANPEFVAFISPYFAFQYNKLFFKTFREANQGLLKKIVAAPLLVSPTHTDTAYQQTRAFLQAEIQTINTLNNELNDEESDYSTETAAKILPDISRNLNVEMLNLLPAYFQTQRNDIAQKLRNVSVAVFNTFDNVKVALQIINFALQLQINNLTKQNLEKDQQQIADIHKEREEAAKFAPILLKYIVVVEKLHKILKNIISPFVTLTEVQNLVNINQLNSEPDILDELREQIALIIRAMSVEIYNEKSDFNTALELIKIAQQINVKDTTAKKRINDAKSDLQRVQADRVNKEREELNLLIELVNKVNYQTRGDIQNINQTALKELLVKLFRLGANGESIFPDLAHMNQPQLVKTLVYQLIELSESMEQKAGRNFLRYVLDIAANGSTLKQHIENSMQRAGKRHKSKLPWGCIYIILVVVVIIGLHA